MKVRNQPVRLRQFGWWRILVATCGLVFISSVQAQSPAAKQTAAVPATNASGPTVPDTTQKRALAASDSRKEGTAFIFGPTYLPKEVELSKEQVEAIRAIVVLQVSAYHESLIQQNKVAGEKHQLWLTDYKRSQENDQWNRLHTQEVLSDQHFYSKLIFWNVILIVGVALILTIYQFVKDSAVAERAARRLLRSSDKNSASPPQATGHSTATNSDPSNQVDLIATASTTPSPASDAQSIALAVFNALRGQTTLSLGSNGLQLGSQLVGLVILGFALAFFYLYLEKVYPITVAEPVATAASAPAK